MSNLAATQDLFFARTELDRDNAQRILREALAGCDDGDLFLEYRQSEAISLDDGRIRSASFDTTQGFGVRAISGEASAYAHSGELSNEALKRAADTVKAVRGGRSGNVAAGPAKTNRTLYTDANPLSTLPFEAKVALLEKMDAYARGKDPRVKQVMASITGSWQAVHIIRPDGTEAADLRPLVRLNVAVVVGQGDRMESGSYGLGGRIAYDFVIQEDQWQHAVEEALRQALVNLDSIAAPAGEMPVLLGPGWPGVLLHEAVGHGLEGDFNRKKTSAFSELMGKQVAAKGVTVIDQGDIENRRGSLTIDDEGTPTQKNVLIEDGILTGFMFDRMNAHLMGMKPTGNGRRESYAASVMPRMTNTFMAAGDKDPEEMLRSMKKGIYAVNFGGGQVDITSGKFVFSASEAYLVEDGKVGAPVKGATLIGNGPEVMKRISMIGNDLQLDTGIGTCGKDGQGVPVGIGQPSLLVDRLTVGGTSA